MLWASGEVDSAAEPEFQMLGAKGEKAVFDPMELSEPDLLRGRSCGDIGISIATGGAEVFTGLGPGATTGAGAGAAAGNGEVPRDRVASKEGNGRRLAELSARPTLPRPCNSAGT